MTGTYRIALKSNDGTLMFTGTIRVDEIVEVPAKTTAPGNGGPPMDTEERMTDPQRRYLFRLLAAQSVEGKQAEEHLKTYFGVSRLADITRSAASAYIDQLIKEKQNAAS